MIWRGIKVPHNTHGFDNRFELLLVAIVNVIDCQAQGQIDQVDNGLEMLLNNTLEFTTAEDRHMEDVCFPAYVVHKLEHYKLCSAIMGIRIKASSYNCTASDLRYFQEMLQQHFSIHDQLFEKYLATGDIS